MNTLMQIEKLKEEYDGMSQELYDLQQKYDILNKEYKKLNIKLFDINDKIDDLMEEEYRITRKIKEEEKKYIAREQTKLVCKTVISLLVLAVSLSFILWRTPIPTSLLAGISFLPIGPLIYLVAFTSKTERKIKNKYRQTENYIKNKELVEQKVKEIAKLKSERKSLGDPYELYKKVSNLEKQIEAKQKEMEDIKQQVFDFFFGDINYNEVEEKSAPLVKTRRIEE